MNIELGILQDGCIAMVCDEPFPDIVKRVEYYRDQRMIMLIYKKTNEELEIDDQLLEFELPEDMSKPVEKCPNVTLISLYPGHAPLGYKVPLIKVGALY